MDMDIEAEKEQGLQYGQTFHLNLFECPFIDNLVSNTVYHLTGRSDVLDTCEIATTTVAYILALLEE